MAHPETIRRRSPKPARLPRRLLAAMGLVALLGGMAVVVLTSREGSDEAPVLLMGKVAPGRR